MHRKAIITIVCIVVLVATAYFCGTQIGRSASGPICDSGGTRTVTDTYGGVIITSSASCESR